VLDPEVPRVDPVRLDPAGGVSRRRALWTGAALVGFIGIALLKPWASSEEAWDTPRATGSPPDARPSAIARSTPDEPLAPKLAVFRPTDASIRAALRSRTTWGIRALVPTDPGAPPSRRSLIEIWTELTGPHVPTDRQAWRPEGSGILELDTGDLPVIALGLTGPDLDVPLATRIWRLVPGAVPELVVPQSAPAEPGRPVWFARDANGSSLDTWHPGTYRIDLLDGAAIRRVVFRVPGVAPAAPRPGSMTVAMELDAATLAALRAPDADRTGVALLNGGSATALPVATGRSADELTAWVDPFELPTPPTRPTRVVAANPTTIAWFPDSGSDPLGARVSMLAPIERRFTLSDQLVPASPAVARDVILLRWATGRPWPAGVYRVEAAWRTTEGTVDAAAWHLELVPVRDRRFDNTLMSVVRDWTTDRARAARRVLGTADRLEGSAVGLPGAACADRRLLEPGPTGIGLTGLPGQAIVKVDVTRLFENRLGVPVRVGVAPRAASDLAILAAPRDGWEPGAYRISVRLGAQRGSGTGSTTFLACVGVRGPAGSLRFDPATTVPRRS